MTMTMRRKEREIADFNDVISVLDRCDTIRIGMIDGDGIPYVVPLSFGYEALNGSLTIFIHGATEGKKVDILSKGGKVFVEADIFQGFRSTGHSVTCDYESVMGVGIPELISGDEAMRALTLLLDHCGFPNYPLESDILPAVSVYKIKIQDLTGKRRSAK
jgi:nitroimidazol reductase NimA-like FMN-containing flavoprotein (pyridoxamine 5'-phosphate oxidase superfamily)